MSSVVSARESLHAGMHCDLCASCRNCEHAVLLFLLVADQHKHVTAAGYFLREIQVAVREEINQTVQQSISQLPQSLTP